MATRTFTHTHGQRYRIHPDERQQGFLNGNFGCSRKAYNILVELGNYRDGLARRWHEEDPEGREGKAYPHEFPWPKVSQMKAEFPYLKGADSLGLKNAYQAYFEARTSHFQKGAGRPRFRSKWRGRRSYTTDNQHYKDDPMRGTIRVIDDRENHRGMRLIVPKLPKYTRRYRDGDGNDRTERVPDGIAIDLHRPIRGTIKRATLEWEPDGTWWVSLLIEETIEVADDGELPISELARFCFGGDLGVKDYLVGTDGVTYDDPADYTGLEARLRREQRKLGKKAALAQKKGVPLSECRNYQRQKRKVARLQARIANKRRDFRHKLSRHLVDAYRVICLEDLCVRGMLANHSLAKHVQDAAFADFTRMVRYKAEWAGREVVLVDRFYPSTQTCSRCGAKTGPKGYEGLSVREWVCPECGCEHDRDGNAAWNVLLEGLRVLSSSDSPFATQWAAVLAALKGSLQGPGRSVAAAPTGMGAGVSLSRGVDGASAPEPYPDMHTERRDGGSPLPLAV